MEGYKGIREKAGEVDSTKKKKLRGFGPLANYADRDTNLYIWLHRRLYYNWSEFGYILNAD
jgi:hypothetical protein